MKNACPYLGIRGAVFSGIACGGHACLPARQDVVEAYGEDYGNSSGAYLSCGPFRLKSWEEDTITLEKNEAYWDAGSIHLDQILCRLVPDGTTRSLMFESGELNAYLEVLKSNEAHYPEAQSACGNTLVSRAGEHGKRASCK